MQPKVCVARGADPPDPHTIGQNRNEVYSINMSSQENDKGASSPKSIVSNVLWELGNEKPECREVVADIVVFLRGGARQLTAQPKRPTVLGTNMKRWRDAKGMSQKKLGDVVGLGATAICSIERGNSGISKEKLREVSRLFRVSMKKIVEEILEF